MDNRLSVWLSSKIVYVHISLSSNILLDFQSPKLEFLRRFAIGLTAGTLASCVNIPFDVAKSRIQGPQPVLGEIKYSKCFKTILLVYKEEGWVNMYIKPVILTKINKLLFPQFIVNMSKLDLAILCSAVYTCTYINFNLCL